MPVVRFAVGIPNLADHADPRVLAALGREAEAAGWDGVFIWDHIYRADHAPATDPWVALAAIATATSRVRLGALVTPLARRRPWKVARETVALDLLSEGRLVFGAGLGSSGEEEFAAFGDDPDARTRAERLDEGLEVLAGLWSGRPFAFQGAHFRLAERTFLPAPLQTPRIPVWIAGRWPSRPPFRRAARWDGMFPIRRGGGALSPDELADAVAFTRAQREGDEPFDVAMEGILPGDREEAGERLAAYAAAGLTWWIEQVGWFRGPADEMEAVVRRGPPV
jgi:alkanesulfonate monooxygenase SsuD/methylene tetrahydromethanopterin reductase-like flavin-dependent oxidoreductase (luciferase family)